jgi:methionyl-tRNA formyltransferase
MARQLGVAVKGFDRLGNPECLAYLHELRPTVAINLSGVYLSRKLLDSFEMGIIGGHYAELPRIRGGDTVRWTVLLDAPMIVTHMFLVPGLDLGDILRTVSIPVRRGDDILTIRGKCQAAAIAGHLELIDGLANGALERRRQQPEEGSTFYRMGDYLRGEVDRILREGQYGHYQ